MLKIKDLSVIGKWFFFYASNTNIETKQYVAIINIQENKILESISF